jgi:hypothetical protein
VFQNEDVGQNGRNVGGLYGAAQRHGAIAALPCPVIIKCRDGLRLHARFQSILFRSGTKGRANGGF